MSVTVHELNLGGDFAITRESATLTRAFLATGSYSQAEVQLAVILSPTGAGLTYFGLVRSAIRAQHLGGPHWRVEVEYANIPYQQAAGLQPSEVPDGSGDPNKNSTPGPNEDLGPTFAFDFSGQTQRIFQSLSTGQMRVAGANGGVAQAPDNQLAIGLSGKEVEGCDVFTPSGGFSRTVYRTSVTSDYLRVIYDLTGRVNYGHTFFGFEEGEVLYLGASGQQVQIAKWTLTHKFAVSRNEAPYVVAKDAQGAPLLQFPEKRGWDYVWVKYEPQGVGDAVVAVPKKAYLEQVYAAGNLLELQIGG